VGCAVYWWGGIPYYYYDNAYYTYNEADAGYELSEPPPATESDSNGDTPPDDQLLESMGNADNLYVYPRNGQDEQQTATDRFECQKWAVAQTGFDPAASGSSGNPDDYRRAMISCLDSRGYSAQ